MATADCTRCTAAPTTDARIAELDDPADTLARVETAMRFLATAAQAEEGYLGAREGLGDLIDICRVTVDHARRQVERDRRAQQ
ncbi:MAG: hypothetical protein NTV11_20370 [Rhodocyclales bacterium]|nr:hypothetical protein [Rhodocyclales bacterium]